MLLPGEANIEGVGIMTSRNWASDVLKDVAALCDAGMYPTEDVSAFDFGRAIGRALINCNNDGTFEQNKNALLKGIEHYHDQWHKKAS